MTGKLTEAQFRKAMIRYKRGDSVRQIARDFDISPSALHQRAKRLGIEWGGRAAREARAAQRRLLEEAIAEKAKATVKPVPMVTLKQKKATKPRRHNPHVSSIAYPKTVSEIIRLHRLGRTRSEIAALLRMPYRQIETAIELGS
ncbi:MAG: hypothetical protein PBV01_11595 [Brucella anthropi]